MISLILTTAVCYQQLKTANDILELSEYIDLVSIDSESKSLLISEKIICNILNKAIKKRDISGSPKSYFYQCGLSSGNFGSALIVLEYEKFGKVAFKPKFIKIEKENLILHYDAFLMQMQKNGLGFSIAKKVTSDLRWIDVFGVDSTIDQINGVEFKDHDERLSFIGVNKTYLLNSEISGIFGELLNLLNKSGENVVFELEVDFHKIYIKNPNLSDHILLDVLILLRKVIGEIIER